jgi:hypothetical protein
MAAKCAAIRSIQDLSSEQVARIAFGRYGLYITLTALMSSRIAEEVTRAAMCHRVSPGRARQDKKVFGSFLQKRTAFFRNSSKRRLR